ncbi:hypothetical protein LTR05_005400 [Lithohypha guttulata]|uniref:Myb-like domain-containing protein n=1 Tax=Lithohypha guttulata TaxID=1690604 RepID=A0AAN7Y5X4_9EURO|nr:hypothetical protein LTR05_005400 [Lithohypha guttulata]
MGWDTTQQAHYYHLDAQQHQQYNHYQQQVYQAQYNPMPTPISGALPVQSTRISIAPIEASRPDTPVGNNPWTPLMDEILVENHKRMKWEQISEQFFQGKKSGNACRKRFSRVIQERQDPSRWPPEQVQQIRSAYQKDNLRKEMWMLLAERTGCKWEDLEKLCFGLGLKQMLGKTPYGHKKRVSLAASHRSNRSISDDGQDNSYDEGEPTNDSGLGGDLQADHSLLHIPTHSYATRESYHTTMADCGPGPEAYYRNYHN